MSSYMIAVDIAPSAVAAGTNLFGLRKLAGKSDVRILSISVTLHLVAAGLGSVPVAVYRASSVAGGTLVAATAVPKKRTWLPDATLEVRTGAVTGTKAAQKLLLLGGSPVVAANTAGPLYSWDGSSDPIYLVEDEGLIFEQFRAGDLDNRYEIRAEWDEALT